jgi:hypothetical protein
MSECPNAWVAEDPTQPGTAFALCDADPTYADDAAEEIADWQNRFGVKARLVNKEDAKKMLVVWDRNKSSLSTSPEQAVPLFKSACKCGQKFLIEKKSGKGTNRADGKRIFYPGEEDVGLCVFRCWGCHAPVHETVPGAEYGEALANN